MIDHGFGVSLGTIDQAHAPLIRSWRNSYKVWRWTRQNDLINEQRHADWLEWQAKDPATRMYVVKGAVKMGEEPRPVGVTGLTSLDFVNRRAEFSLYIADNFRGSRFGEKALSTLLSHAFKTLGLQTVWGETFDGNPAATLFEGLGFKKEGTRRRFYYRDGKWLDAHLYSILAEEWKR